MDGGTVRGQMGWRLDEGVGARVATRRDDGLVRRVAVARAGVLEDGLRRDMLEEGRVAAGFEGPGPARRAATGLAGAVGMFGRGPMADREGLGLGHNSRVLGVLLATVPPRVPNGFGFAAVNGPTAGRELPSPGLPGLGAVGSFRPVL